MKKKDNAFLALDKIIANEFHKCAEKTREYPHDYGEMRRLRIELQELCGITEIEALNVLIYRNVSDYIWKYNAGSIRQLPEKRSMEIYVDKTRLFLLQGSTDENRGSW